MLAKIIWKFHRLIAEHLAPKNEIFVFTRY